MHIKVNSVSIVTGYGKARTRGRRMGDDGMRKRCKAMLGFMGIKELEQPNLGRIHIDIGALKDLVKRHGGRITFDRKGYDAWKDMETTNNVIPDVGQKIRPRYKPEVPGSGRPPFIRVETEITSPEYILGPDVQPQTNHDSPSAAAAVGVRRDSWTGDRETGRDPRDGSHPSGGDNRRGSTQTVEQKDGRQHGSSLNFRRDSERYQGNPSGRPDHHRGSYRQQHHGYGGSVGPAPCDNDSGKGPGGADHSDYRRGSSFRSTEPVDDGRRKSEQQSGRYDRPYDQPFSDDADRGSDNYRGPPVRPPQADAGYGDGAGRRTTDDNYGDGDGNNRKRDFGSFKQQQSRGYNLEPDNSRRRQY